MRFQVIIEPKDGMQDRRVASEPFENMDEAEQSAAAVADTFQGVKSYDQASGSWMVNDLGGGVFHIIVEPL